MSGENISDSELLLRKGLAEDLIWCEIHYFVYRTLGENYAPINEVSDDGFQKHVAYLQGSAHDLMLLHLSRIYDRGSNRYKVRCLDVLVQECEKLQVKDFPIPDDGLEDYPSLVNLSKLSGLKLKPTNYSTNEGFRMYLNDILESDRVKNAVKNLKIVRSKFIAHNEHNPDLSGFNTFWDDCFFLMGIAKLFLSNIGLLYFNTNYRLEDDVKQNKVDLSTLINANWLVEYLEKYISEGKLVHWWSDDES